MSRLPSLINRAVLLAPMIRNKCGMKCFDYKFPIPQSITQYFVRFASYLGLGTMHALGFFVEQPTDKKSLYVTTSNQGELDKWQAVREKYPRVISDCVTNDWVSHSINAQKKFNYRYEFVRTNTIVVRYVMFLYGSCVLVMSSASLDTISFVF